MAQSDARPTGEQEIAGSIPAGSGNMLLWRLIMKYFLRTLFLPTDHEIFSADIVSPDR